MNNKLWAASLLLMIGGGFVAAGIWWVEFIGLFVLFLVVPLTADGIEARRQALGDPKRDHKIAELYARLAELKHWR